MSSLRAKYEASKRSAYIPRSNEEPRARSSSDFYPRVRPSSSVPKRNYSPIRSIGSTNTEHFNRDGSSSNRYATESSSVNDYSPIRSIPFASTSRYFSPSSLFKSGVSSNSTPGTKIVSDNGKDFLNRSSASRVYKPRPIHRVSKLSSQKKGVLSRLGSYFYNRLAGTENSNFGNIDANASTPRKKKHVLFDDESTKRSSLEPMPLYEPPKAADTLSSSPQLYAILKQEQEKNERIKKSYEEAMRRLEDELDYKDQEINSTKEALKLREIESSERLQELENSFQESLLAERKADEDQYYKEKQRLEELEESIKDEKERLKNQQYQMELERKLLVDEAKEIEEKRKRYEELEAKKQQVIDGIREQQKTRRYDLQKDVPSKNMKPSTPLPTASTRNGNLKSASIDSKYLGDRSFLEQQRSQIQSETKENDSQQLRFFETLVNISDSISTQPFLNKTELLEDLEQLVNVGGSTNHERNSPSHQKRDEKISQLKDKINDYLKSVKEITSLPPSKSTDLLHLFDKLKNNLSVSLERRRRAVRQFDHEIFKINLMLADPDTITRVLSSSSKSVSYFKYSRFFERKGTLLGEMLTLNELLLKLNYLTNLVQDHHQVKHFNGRHKDLEIVTSTPRFRDGDREKKERDILSDNDFSLSPINISSYIAELDRSVDRTR